MIKVPCSRTGINRAAKIVREGGIVVFPTDTVYGVGCDPTNEDSVMRLISLKGRRSKPLPVLCQDLDSALKVVRLGATGLELAHRFWPGPLTIVGRLKGRGLAPTVSAGTSRLGVRVPNHSCALKLLRLLGGYLVGTSANRSGLKPPTTPGEVLKVFRADFDLLLDAGRTPLGQESTVVDITEGSVRVLREGCISSSVLMSIFSCA